MLGGLLLVAVACVEALGWNSPRLADARATLVKLADDVLDADYRADLPRLQRLYETRSNR